MRISRGAALVVLLGAVTSSVIARADVVGPPPESCPPGSTASSSHSGPFCSPTSACTDDAMCTEGTCMETRQCIEMRGCGGRIEPDAGPCTLPHIVGECGPGNTCEIGECFTRHICSVADVTPGARSSTGGCACTVGTTAPSGAALLAASIILAMALARAQSRTRSRITFRNDSTAGARRAPAGRSTR